MNNIILAILPHPSLKNEEIRIWEKSHPDAKIFTSFTEALEYSGGPSLFHDPLGCKIFIEDVTANDFRMFINDCHEDVLVITPKKPRANFEKDGISIIDLSIPKKSKEAIRKISQQFEVNSMIVRKIMDSTDDEMSMIDKVEQYSYIDNQKHYSYGDLYNIKKSNNPPWDITEAIISGDPSLATKNTILYINKSTDQKVSTSLMFQIIGYFKKVVSVNNDKGKIVDNKQFFRGKAKKLKDELGLTQDMTYYSNTILNSPRYSGQMVCCMVASMASRFKG